MANPLPQTGNGFPRRTTDQSPLPNRPAESGEKDLKQPVELDRSASRSRKAESEESTAEDWGLSESRGGMSLAKKLAIALGLAAVAAGGAYGYMYYYPKSTETSEAEQNVAEGNGEGEAGESGSVTGDGAKTTESDDPFDTQPGKRTALTGKSGAAPALIPVPEEDDLGLGDAPPPRKPQPRTSASRSLADLELELNQDIDEPKRANGSRSPALVQTEPGEEAPELLTLEERPKGTTLGVNSRNSAGLKTGPAGRHEQETARSTQRLAAKTSDDPFAGKLDGYTVIEEQNSAAKTRIAPSAPAISGQEIDIPDVDEIADERLKGFQIQDDLSQRRAIARTVVTRGPAGTSGRNSGARLTSGFEGNDGLDASPSAPGASRGGSSSIMPKRTSPPAGTVAPLGEVYTVGPNDNYWMISKKQYGTSKYFGALVRHNESRIPDPHKMKPGMTVETPPAEVLEQRYPDLIEKSPRVARKPAIDDGVPHFGGDLEGDYLKEQPLARGLVFAPSSDDGPAGYFVDASGAQYYRVGSDDTLTGIAQKHLGRASRWMEVYELNRKTVKNPDALTIGTVIRLPADASRLSLVPDTERRR